MKSKDEALKAVRDLHADTSVHVVQTLEALEEVRELVNELIEACEEDLQP